ncbi:hypothetical protein [Carnobacterium sp.]|uniref:hypothetical protein n=1 Tax=Carnobacterium sp. TaxID=48221 RepID=UPI003C76FEC4
MTDVFKEYSANFSAIADSERIPKPQKKNLLKNILKDIDYIFTNEYKQMNCSESKKEAVLLISCLENKLNKL